MNWFTKIFLELRILDFATNFPNYLHYLQLKEKVHEMLVYQMTRIKEQKATEET